MQTGKVFACASVDGTQFKEQLITNAAVMYDIPLPSAVGAAGVSSSKIRAIRVISSQNLSFDLQYFATHNGPSADPNVDTFLSFWSFIAAMASVGPNGMYYYFVSGLDNPYEDADITRDFPVVQGVAGTPALHLRLVNRDAATKQSYGAGTHFQVTTWLEPTASGW